MVNVVIGQKVFLRPVDYRHRRNELAEATITKIGRKYFTVEIYEGQPIQFDLSDGKQKYTGMGYGYDYVLYWSEQEFSDEKESNELCRGIRRQFEAYSFSRKQISLDKLRRIQAILDEEARDAEG